MSAPFRRLARPLSTFGSYTQCTCRWAPRSEQARCFSNSPVAWSGHNKWSTIKHDKGKADAAKSKQRALLTKDITNAVKLGGPDPNLNSRLALAIATAKKSAVPKASMEAAMARGQGLSTSGAALENVMLEAMLPPSKGSLATLIECQTDSRNRTLAELRLLVKEAGGSVSPVGYMFEKKGRITFVKKDGVSADEVLEPALEAGALDVTEDEEGRVVLYVEPAQTKATGEALAKQLGIEIAESEIIYDPNEETKVALDDEEASQELGNFLDLLSDVNGLQGVYLNWAKGAINEGLWAELQSKADV
ncbi:YebC-like protein [Byssothecium circinans]|uniref:YebC-like protein n=1 Tax=Byssothecium circinans TaxID=147558 RepID=A0A6A5UB88_9PLEO|nr:YebC-like protein [Byssothecium circinans]